ncbi:MULTISPECIES: hypothetical protein [Clostridia]|uniref:hypothetical protein n=1 Tax=Clostridia TaxID=186801 RepID=UPI000EBA462F|nr:MULTISPECIES: hypothetical protein [Clostridia]NBJ71346.1 hypothetical protein [Roseburia sp. 1XD42-34]
MTLTEFLYKKYAQEYKEIDELYKLHLVAFLNRNATLTKNVGTDKKPKEEFVYKKFDDFFDYDRIIKQVDEGFTKKEEKKENKRLSPAELAAIRNRKG